MYYSNRRGYTPYYNYDKEVQEAMKNFKPRRTPILDKNGVYITTGVDQSWYQEDLQRYLSGVLSEKAKQQMGIEARVRFGSNPQALASLYSQEAASTLPALDNNIEQLQRKFDAASKPDLKKMYEEELEFYKDQRNQMRQNLEAIKNGDMNFLMNNQTGMANRLYMNSKIRGWSEAYAHEDKEIKLDFDDYLITQFKEQQANHRARLHEEGEDRRARMKNQDSMVVSPTPVNVPAVEASEESVKTLKEEISGKKQTLRGLHNDLKAHIAQVKGGGRNATDITDAELEVFIKENKNDNMALQYAMLNEDIRADEQNLTSLSSNEDSFIKSQLGTQRYRLYKALQDSKLKFIDDSKRTTQGDMGNEIVRKANDQAYARIKQYSEYAGIQSLGMSKKDADEILRDVEAAKALYKKKTGPRVVTRTGATIASNSPVYKKTTDVLSQTAGIKQDNITGIQYVVTPAGTDLYVTVDKGTKSNPTDYEAIKNRLIVAYGVPNVTVDKSTGTVYIPKVGSMINPQIDPYGQINTSHRKYLLQLDEAEGQPNTIYDKRFFVKDRSGQNRLFTITKSFSSDPSNDGYYLYGPSDQPYLGRRFSTPLEAYSTLASVLNESPAVIDRLFQQPK